MYLKVNYTRDVSRIMICFFNSINYVLIHYNDYNMFVFILIITTRIIFIKLSICVYIAQVILKWGDQCNKLGLNLNAAALLES